MGYFVAGWSATNPTRSCFWGRRAASSEPQPESSRPQTPGPPPRERAVVFGAGRWVPEQEPTATPVTRLDQPWRWHQSETWLARPSAGRFIQGQRAVLRLKTQHDAPTRVISLNMKG